MKASNFTVSNGTTKFINSIQFLMDFKDIYFAALESTYGEDQAAEFLAADGDSFDALEASLAKHLMFSVTDHLAGNEDLGII